MCRYFSCIVKKDKSVIWESKVNNHHELLEKYNITDNTDNTDDQHEMTFARIEIQSPKNIPFYPLSKWKFKINEKITPEWFSPAHKQACFKALKIARFKALKIAIANIFSFFDGSLDLWNYNHPLSEGFTHCDGSLDLRGYNHPLPKGFTYCDGSLDLRGYNHPLPKGFTHCGGYLDLRGYNHPLLEGFIHCNGSLYLKDYNHPLPEGFTSYNNIG